MSPLASDGHGGLVAALLAADVRQLGHGQPGELLEHPERRPALDRAVLLLVALEHDAGVRAGRPASKTSRTCRMPSSPASSTQMTPFFGLVLELLVDQEPGDGVGLGEALLAEHAPAGLGGRSEHDHGPVDARDGRLHGVGLARPGGTADQDDPVGGVPDVAGDGGLLGGEVGNRYADGDGRGKIA